MTLLPSLCVHTCVYRMFQDVRSALGHGVCLLDFSTAVDLTCFPDDVSFVGSGRTVCPQMKEGKPWKWQVLQ